MKKILQTITVVGSALSLTLSAIAGSTVYNDEASFRAAAGLTITYGFEVHSLPEGVELSSPLLANQLNNSFEISYTGLNSFQIINNPADPGIADGTRDVFTHSIGTAPFYTLRFSNFDAMNSGITAFGLTVTDFASGLTENDPLATITYDTGGLTGTLLSIPGGQPDFTQNFVGVIVDDPDAFSSITLTFNDVLSGMQWFDEVIYSEPAPSVPETGTTFVFLGLALLTLGWLRRRGTR